MITTIPGTTSMPRKLPPFVERWRDRHGRIRIYFRRGRGARVPLPGAVGSDEFNIAYAATLAGQEPLRPAERQIGAGTIEALILSYKRSPRYLGLRQTTKRGYQARLEMLRTVHGHRTVSGLTRERIENGILL